MDTELAKGELECKKDLLKSKVSSQLRDIATERAWLDNLEQLAVQEMLLEVKEYQELAGANLDQAINSPDTVIHSEAPTEMEARSEADLELGFNVNLVQVPSSDQDA
jgi:hypothetical protein